MHLRSCFVVSLLAARQADFVKAVAVPQRHTAGDVLELDDPLPTGSETVEIGDDFEATTFATVATSVSVSSFIGVSSTAVLPKSTSLPFTIRTSLTFIATGGVSITTSVTITPQSRAPFGNATTGDVITDIPPLPTGGLTPDKFSIQPITDGAPTPSSNLIPSGTGSKQRPTPTALPTGNDGVDESPPFNPDEGSTSQILPTPTPVRSLTPSTSPIVSSLPVISAAPGSGSGPTQFDDPDSPDSPDDPNSTEDEALGNKSDVKQLSKRQDGNSGLAPTLGISFPIFNTPSPTLQVPSPTWVPPALTWVQPPPASTLAAPASTQKPSDPNEGGGPAQNGDQAGKPSDEGTKQEQDPAKDDGGGSAGKPSDSNGAPQQGSSGVGSSISQRSSSIKPSRAKRQMNGLFRGRGSVPDSSSRPDSSDRVARVRNEDSSDTESEGGHAHSPALGHLVDWDEVNYELSPGNVERLTKGRKRYGGKIAKFVNAEI